mmetsp:Transcript_59619/g.98389  ORF Transcript_59619/g.98389 Transcript_59619/m.98389 type:complete len:472 (-) Transcript_59619:33-1448(-)
MWLSRYKSIFHHIPLHRSSYFRSLSASRFCTDTSEMSLSSTKTIVSEIDSMISMLDSSPKNKKESTQQSKQQKQSKQSDADEKAAEELNAGRTAGTAPNDCSLAIDDRVRIAASVGEECITQEELHTLLSKKRTRPIAYDGFEPSGRMHIAQGILKAINVNKLTSVGCDFVFWVADWFALLNNKMGGDLQAIRTVGQYMIEVWKAAGMDMQHVYFRWCSDDINAHSNEYWLRVIEISKMFSVTRTKRCCTILGRSESGDMPTANLMYACMQCADIFFLKADICQLGMDQRKVNMLAREYAKQLNLSDDGGSKRKSKKRKKSEGTVHPPVVISHHMLMGLKQGQEKMSKSMTDSAIFMEDSVDDVRRKIKKAYGPPGVVEANPILDYTEHLVFGKFDTFTVQRKPDNGGPITYTSYQQLEDDYKNERLHPADLKPALANAINDMIEPVRLHFKNDKHARNLLAQVKKLQVTR